MGPRLWSDFCNGVIGSRFLSAPNPAFFSQQQTTQPNRNQTHFLQIPVSESHSVLYVCERVNSNSSGGMSRNRPVSTQHSSRKPSKGVTHTKTPKESTLGFPIQVSLPDGETARHIYNPSLKHSCGPEQAAEMVRGYIKAPENKSLLDVELEASGAQRSHSVGVLGTSGPGERWSDTPCFEVTTSSSSVSPRSVHGHMKSCSDRSSCYRYRYSTPLDGRGHPPRTSFQFSQPSRNLAGSPGFSFSSSSSCSSMSSNCSSSGHASRSHRSNPQRQFLPAFLPTLGKSDQRKRSPSRPRHQQLRDGNQQFPFGSSLATALAEITVVPCETASDHPNSRGIHESTRGGSIDRPSNPPNSSHDTTPLSCSAVMQSPPIPEDRIKDKKRTRSLSNFNSSASKGQNK